MKSKGFIICFILCAVKLVEGLKCPGLCLSKEACKERKGKIRGYCLNEEACCDLEAAITGSCDKKMTGRSKAVFESPSYPAYRNLDLTCPFDLKLDPDYKAILIEFVDAYMEGLGLAKDSQCDGGMLIISGFGSWRPTPFCGNLTGYAVLIEKSEETRLLKTLKILGVMSGAAYRWKIRITQIFSGAPVTTDVSTDDNELFGADVKVRAGTNLPENIPVFSDEDRIVPSIAESLIQNGVDTNISQVPWQVSLRRVYPESLLKKNNLSLEINRVNGTNCTDIGKHFCGGSIISDQHVLTAAHCITQSDKYRGWTQLSQIRVYLGDTNLCLDDGLFFGQPSKTYSVEQIVFHYNYDHDHHINDIAVIKLKEKIKFLDYVQPISLPPQFEGPKNKTPSYGGKQAKFSGWGLTNLTQMDSPTRSAPRVLQYTEDLTVQSRYLCSVYIQIKMRIRKLTDKYRWIFHETLCTNATTGAKLFANLGPGDSGGPLYIQEKVGDDPVQIGIASYIVRGRVNSSAVQQSLTDVYTNVAFFRSWIDFVLRI